MKIMRVWFVALMVVGLMRNEPIYSVVWLEPEEYVSPFTGQCEEVIPEIPENREWFSFLDQTTGTWKVK